ncbi:ABC transporter substrate-binding protein [Microbacterium sp. A93]|uniref:ABC transporter substrate-binding protein n=1 Tax=Microbacterium sp. A93 TaxID=3450716 RepID=UPI003F42BDD3
MKITRRLTAVAGIGAVFALTACATGSGAPAETAVAGEDVVLRYGMWNVNQEPTFRAIADAFEDENPGVTVEIELTPISEYWTKLQTSVQGDSAPDVFWMNHLNLPLYASNGVLASLDQTIEAEGVDTSEYPESILTSYQWEDAQYGLPQDLDTIGLWYNKSLFDVAGVEYPTADWTWDDVESAAVALTDPAQGVFGIASSVDSQSNYYNTVYQAGVEVLSADGTSSNWATPEAHAGIDFWRGFIDAGQSPTVAQLAETPAHQLFPSGKLAMYYSGTWNVGPYTDDPALVDIIDVAPLPAGEREGASVNSLVSAVNAKSANVDMAAQFAAFTASETAAQIRIDLQDKAPAFGETWRDWAVNSPFALTELYEESLAAAFPLPATLNTAEWTSIEVDAMTKIFAGEVPVDTGLDQLAVEVDKVLKAAK